MRTSRKIGAGKKRSAVMSASRWLVIAWLFAVAQPWLGLCCDPVVASTPVVAHHHDEHPDTGVCDEAPFDEPLWLGGNLLAKFDKGAGLDLAALVVGAALLRSPRVSFAQLQFLAFALPRRDLYLQTRRLRL